MEAAPAGDDAVTRDPLATLIVLRDLDRDEVMRRFAMGPEHVAEDRVYEGLRGVTHLHNPATSPAHFYADGPRVVLVYVADPAALGDATAATLTAALGGPGHVLRSRQCKHCVLHVYPERGVAFSAEDDEVGFVELFAPTTLADYRRTVYREPPAFVK